jgi:hypothetical protein
MDKDSEAVDKDSYSLYITQSMLNIILGQQYMNIVDSGSIDFYKFQLTEDDQNIHVQATNTGSGEFWCIMKYYKEYKYEFPSKDEFDWGVFSEDA